MPYLEQLGMQLGTQAAEGVLGLALGGINDRRQLKQQQKLQDMQIAGNKQMGDYNYAKQIEMWGATSYPAQMDKLKEAGLNPSLMYGMGGGGGQSTGSAGGGVTGAEAPKGGGEAVHMAGLGIQAGLMEAQRKNIEADTELKKVDAQKRSGVDTTLGQSEIANLAADTKNKQLQGTLLQYEQRLKDMEVAEKGATINDRIEMVQWALRQAIAGVEKSEGEAFIMSNTKDAAIETIKKEAIGAALKNTLMEAKINVDKAQIQKWANEIAQQNWNLDRQERELTLRTFEAQIRADFPGISQALGNILSGAIDGIMDLTVPKSKRNNYPAPDTKKRN